MTARLPDRRYTVQRECHGWPRPKWVARFCGQWIGKSDTRAGAVFLAGAFEASRWCRAC